MRQEPLHLTCLYRRDFISTSVAYIRYTEGTVHLYYPLNSRLQPNNQI